jgi:hypothetical protein
MKFLRFSDLKDRGIFNSRMTLKRAIDERGFPQGRLLTPGCRAWTEDEVSEWLASRPVARKTVADRSSGEAA